MEGLPLSQAGAQAELWEDPRPLPLGGRQDLHSAVPLSLCRHVSQERVPVALDMGPRLLTAQSKVSSGHGLRCVTLDETRNPPDLSFLTHTSKRMPYSRFALSKAEPYGLLTSLSADPVLLLMHPDSTAGFPGVCKSVW